ncbi:GNAT family N-acetyltransferase [Roseovarius arcticus]|uniref:GNAT family N-acetyltransferase n=1 Tax=Roseovarius arcticus TaxID=2547404 RepID=UPI001486EE91|nr:GNAT family N-acetyltransferase [Roseovarius arcticus]
MMSNIPRIETERLILRAPEQGDIEPTIEFLMDPVRSAGFGHEPDRSSAWRWFAMNMGHWALRGYGYFIIEDKASGLPCGLVGIWAPEGWPEPELGYVVFEGFEGRGIAYEAAIAARAWGYTNLGLASVGSHIVPGNTRSIALAERMGATYERTYTNPHMGEDMIYRHPSPAELGLVPAEAKAAS